MDGYNMELESVSGGFEDKETMEWWLEYLNGFEWWE